MTDTPITRPDATKEIIACAKFIIKQKQQGVNPAIIPFNAMDKWDFNVYLAAIDSLRHVLGK